MLSVLTEPVVGHPAIGTMPPTNATATMFLRIAAASLVLLWLSK